MIARAQVNQSPVLTKTKYEAGIPYTESLGTVFSPCDADDYSVHVVWGETRAVETGYLLDPNITQANGASTVASGRHPFATAHIFTNPGTYTVVISNENCHCFGSTDRFTLPSTSSEVSVYKRVAVSRLLVVGPQTVRSGKVVTVKLQLAEIPPPSNTRVFMRVSDEALLDTSFPFDKSVDMPASEGPIRDVVLHIARGITQSKHLTLTAQSGGSAVSVVINILP